MFNDCAKDLNDSYISYRKYDVAYIHSIDNTNYDFDELNWVKFHLTDTSCNLQNVKKYFGMKRYENQKSIFNLTEILWAASFGK